MTYSIRNVTPFTSSFHIDNTTGVITVGEMLDRESQSGYNLVVAISDGLYEDTLNVNVIVKDVNDNVPTPLQSLYNINVAENVPINMTILNVPFSDPDEGVNALVLFDLTVLTPHYYSTDPFAVYRNSSRTADLVTAVLFDFEQINVTKYELLILGYNSDSQGSGGSFDGQGNMTTVFVTILDENDNVPNLIIANQTVHYEEGVQYISLPPMTVTDPDTFPILCANVILQGGAGPLESLYIEESAIPSGFRTEFINGILYIDGQGTPDNYSMILSSIRYRNVAGEFNGSLTRNITVFVADRLGDTIGSGSGSGNDSGNSSGSGSGFNFKNIYSSVDVYASDSLIITLVPLNDPPQITCAPVSLDPIDEDDVQSSGQSVMSLFAQLISDDDNSDVGIALIQSPMISQGQLQKQENLNSGFTPLLSPSITSAYLLRPTDLLRFVPASNVYGNFSFQFLAWDGTGNFTTLNGVDTAAFSDGHEPFSNTSCVANITVNPVNDPPVIELGGVGLLNISQVYIEGRNMITSIDIAPNASVSDVDSDRYLERLVVNISSLEYGCAGVSNSTDVVYCVNMSSIPIMSSMERHGPSCISYTFEGRHTIMEWQAVIQSCKFRIDDNEPSSHTRLLQYTVYDSEEPSLPGYATINVQLQNDNCPDLSVNGDRNPMVMYVEHSGSVIITGSSLQLTDPDDGMIEAASATITPRGACSECILRVNTSVNNAGIAQSFGQSTLNITGPASISDFEAVLQTLEFEDRANEPDASNVDIVITVSDGDETNCALVSPSNMISINLMIIVVHDQAAEFYPNGGNETSYETVFTEGGNPVPIVGSHAVIVDSDFMQGAAQTYTMTVALEIGCGVSFLIPTITASNVIHPYNSSHCSVTFSGTASNLETDLMQLRFSSDSRNPIPLLQRVRFMLQDFNFTTYSVTEVAITTVNDAPVVDLNVSNSSYPNTNVIFDISAGVTNVRLVGSMGSSITDIDNSTLQSLTLTLQEFSNITNNPVNPRSDVNQESLEPPSNLATYGLSSSGFNQLSNMLVINGIASLANYTAVLDSIVYQNLQSNPRTNIRRVTIVANDGISQSNPVRATVMFTGENNPPILENIPTENVKLFANDSAITVLPDIFINEPDGDLICTTNISGDCDLNSFDFSDIMYPDLISFDTNNGTLVLHTTPFSCLLPTTFSSILRSIKYSSSSEGVCTMTIQVAEQRGLVSDVESIVIETLIRNSPPRVDNDLGAPGTGFATQYFQGVMPVRIVSIFNATLNSTISPQFFEGEAMGEVGEAPSSIANDSSGSSISLSHAGYLLEDEDEDDDDANLDYLRATIVNSSTSIDDVLVFPCIDPSSTDDSLDTARGCDNRRTSRVIGGRNTPLQYSANVTGNCSQDVDICSGLRVEITCPFTGYKRYTFTYTDGNSSIVRFRALLGCIGYEYLVEVGGYLNHDRCIDISAYDGTDISNVATTKVQLMDVNRLSFDPLVANISICEGEKPSKDCIQFLARPRLITGEFADPTTVEFSIISGDDNKFAINSEGGVYLVNSLDRETRDNYTLVIRAVNLVGEATLTLLVTVEDVNDNHPIILPSYKAEVPEGRSNYVVEKLNATDRDEGSNAELMYFIVGYGSDRFSIDSNGVIRTTTDQLVTGEIYMLVVIVTDRGDIIRYRNDTYQYTDNDNGGLYLSSHTIVAVDVTPVFLPTIMITPMNDSVTIVENQNISTVVVSFTAMNNDTQLSDDIQYTIVSIEPNNPSAAFAIKETSPGRADLIINANLDAELVNVYDITIMASNTSSDQVNPGNAYLTVFINDENDNYPQFIDVPNAISLSEDTPLNTYVLSFMVSDNDISNTSFTFNLSHSFPSDTFGIGEIEQIDTEQSLTNVSVQLNLALDFEDQESGYLRITVYDDDGNPVLSNSTDVSITVLDVNDNPPVPISDPTTASVNETASNGTVVLNISHIYTDVDTVGEFLFTPTIIVSTPFCIDIDQLVVCQPDILTSFEQNGSYIFDIIIHNPPLTPVNVTVDVSVHLVNEFPPIFYPNDTYYFAVPENSPAGVVVGVVTANDDDGGDHGIVDYFGDTQGLPFVIDSRTGNITTNGTTIDRETIPFYSFQVSAIDNPSLAGGIQFTSTGTVNIVVEDLNDNAPVFVGAPYSITVREHPGNDYVLLQFTITDQDTPNVSRLQVTLSSNVPFLYLISNNSYTYSLLVNDSDALDYDAGPRVLQFNMTANDTAIISGDQSHEVVAEVTIVLTNVNDFSPVIHGPQQISVNEVPGDESVTSGSGDGSGAFNPVPIGQVDATDNDMDRLSYSVLDGNCTEDVPFTVNASTGVLLLCRHIDYERRTNYSIVIVVTDGRFSVNSTIDIEVIDRNDNPPTFAEPIVFIVSENSSVGMFVGAIAHSDRDSINNSRAIYTGINVPLAFNLSSTGRLYVDNVTLLDRETYTSSYTFYVSVENPPFDPTDETQLVNITITINITDINEHPPMVVVPCDLYVAENATFGHIVGTIVVTDPDPTAMLYYVFIREGENTELTECTSFFPLQIAPTTGVVSVCNGLDYEVARQYRLIVNVTDGISAVIGECLLSVIDVNDFPPVISPANVTLNVSELTSHDSLLFEFNVTDEDGSLIHRNVTYSTIIPSSVPFYLYHNDTNVQLFLTGTLDYETTQSYSFQIIISNEELDSEPAIVELNVINENDLSPQFNRFSFNVSLLENVTGIYELLTVMATDPDMASGPIVYAVYPPSVPFVMDGNTLVVANQTMFDYDNGIRVYRFNITATDSPVRPNGTQLTSYLPGEVHILDVNDNAPEFDNNSLYYTLREDVEIGIFGMVRARDNDSGTNMEVTYRIVLPDSISGSGIDGGSGIGSTPFTIDSPSNGYLVLYDDLDYEMVQSYHFQVVAMDSGSPSMSSTGTVHITVEDVNDNSPEINNRVALQNFSLMEDIPLMYPVIFINATDADSGENSQLVYETQILNSNTNCTELPFTANESGYLVLCRTLDYETVTSYSFDIVVSDSGVPVLNDSVSVSVTVINVNDNEPVIESDATAAVVEEETGVFVIDVEASDADAPLFPIISYQLSDESLVNFTINETTGEIRTRNNIDREIQDHIIITVIVYDENFNVSQNINVTIMDINDNDPIVLSDPSVDITENTATTITIMATDSDAGNNATLIFSLVNASNNLDYYSINATTGGLTIQPLDRDPSTGGTPQVSVNITVSDSGSPSRSVDFTQTINIVDVNDNAPIFSGATIIELDDGTPVNTVVYTVTATDYDEGSNANLTYSVVSSTAPLDFIPGTPQLQVTEVPMLNGSDELTRFIEIQIQDWNVNPFNRSVTIVNLTVLIQSPSPRFPSDAIIFSVDENANDTLGSAQATVRSTVQLLNYTIVQELPYGNFAINNNGSISAPSCCLDYEDAENYSLVVEATIINNSSLSDTTTVNIALINVNEHSPVLFPVNLTGAVDENTQNGTNVVKALAIDLDFGAAGDVSYVVNDSSIFIFDNISGYLIVINSNALDHESQNEYVLEYQAIDHGTPARSSDIGYITVSVTNIDDVPPGFTMDMYRAVINETVNIGFPVLTVSAVDNDTLQEDLVYSLYPNQTDFGIHPTTGVIVTQSLLDHETQSVYEFSVVVTDTQGLTDTANISIILLDNNDNRPMIRPSQSFITIREVDQFARFPDDLSIEHADNTAKFPVVSITASLRSTDNLSFPLAGGFCDHANYTRLYQTSTAKLCGSGALNLVDFALPSHLAEPGVLDLDNSDNDLIIISNRPLEPHELQNGFCLCMWLNIPARFRSVNARQQLFRLNPLGDELAPLRLLVSNNIFEVGVQNVTGSDDFIELITVPLNDNAYPDFIDGTWHHLCINYNGSTMTLNVDGESIASNHNVTIPPFSDATPLLGERLSGLVSHLHFQPGEMCTADTLMCFLTCGEWLDVDNTSAHENVTFDMNYHQRSITIKYTGDNNVNSIVRLTEAVRSINYYSILEEPHPLDRLIAIEASDMVGSGDASFVVAEPGLINDQVPILDVNGLTDDSASFQTTYIEDSAGIQIISPDAALYDLDSGYWRVFAIKINITEDLSNNILGILEVVGTPQAPLQAVTVSSTCVVINASDGTTQYPELFLDALTKIRYRNPEDEPSLTTTEIVFSVDDGNFTGPPVSTVVTIQPANDPPLIDLNPEDFNTVNNSNTFNEQNGEVVVIPDGSSNITDTDGNMLSGAIITIVDRPDNVEEFLSVDDDTIIQFPSITAQSYNSGTGELRLDGDGTFDDYLTILRTVRYHNTVPGSPDTTIRLISFVVTDGNDRRISSMPAYIFVDIQLYNDPPILYLDGNSDNNINFTYVEDSNCVAIFPDVRLFDLDETSRLSSIVELEGRLSSNELLLINISSQAQISIITNSSGITYRLVSRESGSVYLQAMQEAYRNVYYCNYDDEPDNSTLRTVTVTVREFTGQGISNTVTVNIMRVDDQPEVIITRQDEAAVRNETVPIIDVDSFRLNDSDSTMFDEMVIIIANPINSPSEEIIDFENIRLPADTFIQGPITTGPYPGYQYFVEFRGSGADFTKLRNTIAVLGYRNTAPPSQINTDVPRNICIVIKDFVQFSQPACVNVTISPINQFVPVFVNSSGIIRIAETNDLVTLGIVSATDDDNGLAGVVRYSITVYASNEEVAGLVGIDPMTGNISLLAPLDAEVHRELVLTIVASDQGNPQRSATLNITLLIEDQNDIVPELSIRTLLTIVDGQGNGIRVAEITATDGDATSPNNIANVFSIDTPVDSNGIPLFTLTVFSGGRADLVLSGVADHEVSPSYFVNVSVTDSGTPSNTAYRIIEIPIIDANDVTPVIQQLIEGRYVVGSSQPASIGPVLRIIDLDQSPVIQSVEIRLVPSAVDSSRTFSNCEDERCQSERMEECGLIRPGSFDVISRSEFRLLYDNTSSVTGCNSVRLNRSTIVTTTESAGLGVLDGSNFPPDPFVNFTIVFVATQSSEGYPFVINADGPVPGADRTYARYLGLWLRQARLNFYYSYLTSDGTRVFTDIARRDIPIFNRDDPQRKHIAVVVQGTNLKIYVNCREVLDETLDGIIADPPQEHLSMEIGYPDPNSLSRGQFAGELSDYYYHNYSMSVAEILCTCSCGSEQLVLPDSLPDGITGAIGSDLTNITLTAIPPISLPVMEQAVRDVKYINTFAQPDRTDPPIRQLEFFLYDGENSVVENPTNPYVMLVDSNDNTPNITITGNSSFKEDFDPVRIVSNVSITRNNDTLVPPIFNMTVTLMNFSNIGEHLSGENTSVITVIGSGTTMLTLSGPATPDNYTDALRRITYFNPADIPDTSVVRMIEFCANGQCSPSRAQVTVSPTNDNPTVTLSSPSATASYTEGSNPITFATRLQVNDVDGDMLSSAQVFVQTSPNINEDLLAYNGTLQNGLQIQRVSNYSINITGTGTANEYQEALHDIVFSTSSNPLLDNNGSPTVDTTRTVVFIVTDSNGGTSAPTIVNINFTPRDSPPVIITSGLAVFEDGSETTLLDPNITISDEDNEILYNLSLRLEGAGINEALRHLNMEEFSFSFSSDSRTTFINILRNIRYVNREEEPELTDRFVLITVCDFSSCVTTNLTVEVRDVNDIAPIFNQPSFNGFVAENSVNGTRVLTVTAMDEDRGQPNFTFQITNPSVPFTITTINQNMAAIIVSGVLDFETDNTYEFSIIVNDGGEPNLVGSADVTINVTGVNESPTLDLSGDENSTFNQIELTRFVPAPGTFVSVFASSIVISDVDAGDGVSEASICIQNYQPGDRLILRNVNNTVPVQSEYSGGCLSITRASNGLLSAEIFEQLLEDNVHYERVIQDAVVTIFRNISVEVRDNDGLVSNTAYVLLSLANLPEFNQTVYSSNLTEGVSHRNFLTVLATVEGEVGTLQYTLQDSTPWPIEIAPNSGVLSLTQPLDHEQVQQINVEVYAVDAVPPVRTATATVIINVIDINDNPPNVTCVGSNATVNSDGTVDINIILMDDDTFPLYGVSVELRSDFNVSTNPFTQNTCLDVYNAFGKMSEACELSSDVENLIAASVADRNGNKYNDEFGNEFLRNLHLQSHARVNNYNISGLEDNFTELTFAVWIRIFRGQSGYIISITNNDGSERYFSVYFIADKRQVIVYLKDPSNSGRPSILSVVFQLQFNLDNEQYHFVMIYIQNGAVELVIDQVRISSHLYYSFSTQISTLGKWL